MEAKKSKRAIRAKVLSFVRFLPFGSFALPLSDGRF
jgi:hypothetical protein